MYDVYNVALRGPTSSIFVYKKSLMYGYYRSALVLPAILQLIISDGGKIKEYLDFGSHETNKE